MSLQRKNVVPVRPGEQRITSNSRAAEDERPPPGYAASRTQVVLPVAARSEEIDVTRLSYRRPQRQSLTQPSTSNAANPNLPAQFAVRMTNDGASSAFNGGMLRSVYEHDENLEGDRRAVQPRVHPEPFSLSSTVVSGLSNSRNGSASKQKESAGTSRSNENGSSIPRQRRVFVMRHGERCDFALGRSWLEFLGAAFTKSATLNRQPVRRPNLNVPVNLPSRSALDLAKDPPLTEIGLFQARKTGMALAEAGTKITLAYSSPAFRSVQTCVEVLRGMRMQAGAEADEPKPRICIEAGLFEWCGWYKAGLPNFMTVEELQAFDQSYPLDASYRSHFDARRYDVAESIEEYFKRSADTVDFVLSHAADSKQRSALHTDDILVVGHAGSLYTCTRRLMGRAEPRGQNSVKLFKELASKVPYCGLCVAEELPPAAAAPGKWRLVDPPCPTFVHTANAPFDWRVMA